MNSGVSNACGKVLQIRPLQAERFLRLRKQREWKAKQRLPTKLFENLVYFM